MVHAYLVRAFVYVQISSHAVSRPVQEVGPFAPHCLAGQHVELCAAGALGKAGTGQADVSFEHERVVASFVVGRFAQGDGAGDVCRAVGILCAAVEQEQAFGCEGFVGLGCSLVVHDGCVFLVAGDGVEADAPEERLLGTAFVELAVNAHFRFVSFGDGFFQPFQKLHHRYAVAQHGCMEAADFGLILHSLHEWHGRFFKQHLGQRVDSLADCFVRASRVEAERGVWIVAQVFLQVVVVLRVDAFLREVGFHFSRELLCADVEDAFLGGDEEIADEDGVAVHIVAAQVECPGDVVQRGEQDAVSPAGEELFADGSQFLVTGNAGIFKRMDAHRCAGQGRAVVPQSRDGVIVGAQRQSFPGECFAQGLCLPDGVYPSVHAHHRTRRE